MRKRPPSKSTIVLLFCLAVSVVGNIHLFFRAFDYREGANEWLSKYTNVVEEYSGLSVYTNANKPLKSDSIVDNRVILFGTQVTKRWDIPKHFQEWEMINRGVGRQWSSGLLLRFYQDVIELKPEYVIIEISSYNLRPRFTLEMIQDHLKSMINLAQFNDIQPVLTTMIPQREGYDNFGDYSVMQNLELYNSWVINYCREQNLKCLDLHGILTNDKGFLNTKLSFDAIDPNDQGYKLIFKSLINLLAE